MSILVFVVLLSALIVLFAVAADRSARAHRRWRAGLLNLCGLFLLAVGVLALFAWSHHGRSVSVQFGRPAYGAQQVWDTPPVVAQPSDVEEPVRSLRDEEQPAEVPPAHSEESPAEQPAEKPAEKPAEEPVAEPVAEPTAEAAEMPAEQPAVPSEQPAEKPAGEPVTPTEPPAAGEKGESGPIESGVAEPAAEPGGAAVAGELSASPQVQVEIDYAARPDWVDRPPRDEGSVHQIAVCSGPYLRSHDAHKELQQQLQRVTDEYINEFLGQDSASHWISWDATRIGRELVAARNHFEEKVISPSFGVMYQSHALLEFGPDFHRQVEESWRQIQARAQLVKMGLGAAAVLGTLVLLFGFFQADTATRGFYSGRLKFATAVAILGLIACGVYLARSIPWLWP